MTTVQNMNSHITSPFKSGKGRRRAALFSGAMLSIAATAAVALSNNPSADYGSDLVNPSDAALTPFARMAQVEQSNVLPTTAAPIRSIEGVTFVPGR